MELEAGALLTGILLLAVLGKITTVLLTDGNETDAGDDVGTIADGLKELLETDEGLVKIETIEEVVEALVLAVVVVVLAVLVSVLVVVSLVIARVVVVVLETPGQLLSIHLL